MLHDLIIYTDIGDDIDDSMALRYLHKKNHIRNFIIVLYSYESEKRNHAWSVIEPYFDKKPIIIQGNEISILQNFLETRKRDIPLDVFCIGPATNIAHHITTLPYFKSHIHKLVFQARMKYDGGLFVPDPDSYNYKEDVHAATIISQLDLPIFWIGKYTAYQIGLDEKHFMKRAKSSIGNVLYREGLYRRKRFAEVNPLKCEQVYGHCDHIISFPYDLIAAIAMYHPEYFQRVHQEQNSCCGHDIEHCFKVDKNIVYSHIDEIFN